MPIIRKPNINRKNFILFSLLGVILLSVLIFTGGGHKYNIELFKSGNGWGYDILKDNITYIHQPYIPAVAGQIPFPEKKSARKAGRLVIKKIRNHQSPALTQEEIKSFIE